MVEWATKPAKNMPEGTRMVLRNDYVEAALDHKWGPRYQLDTSIVAPEEWAEQTLKYDIELYQPRTKFVRQERDKGYSDEAIAEALRKKGYTFDSIDDPEDIKLPAPGTAPAKVLLACAGGNRKVFAGKSFEEIAEILTGRTWVAESREGKDGFVRVDGKGFIGPDRSAGAPTVQSVAAAKVRHYDEDAPPPDESSALDEETERDFDSIPF